MRVVPLGPVVRVGPLVRVVHVVPLVQVVQVVQVVHVDPGRANDLFSAQECLEPASSDCMLRDQCVHDLSRARPSSADPPTQELATAGPTRPSCIQNERPEVGFSP